MRWNDAEQAQQADQAQQAGQAERTEDQVERQERQDRDGTTATVPILREQPHRAKTARLGRRKPLLVSVAVLALALATGCTVLAMTVGPSPFGVFGINLFGLGQQSPTTSATLANTATATATTPPTATATTPPSPTSTHVNDGPTYTGGSLPQPTFPGASPSLRDCPGGAPSPPFWPISGIKGSNYATANKEIALTFDDGPSNANSDTPQLLSWLVANHVAATFMVVGVRVAADPNALRAEYADGFEIGIHTWDHPDMTTLSPAGMQRELGTTLALVHQVLGPGSCVWFWRPPYGAYNATVLKAAQSFGLTSIMWDMDPADWSSPGISTIISRVEQQARPGGILLEHDGPGGRWETLAAVQTYVPYLEKQGYHFVTVGQLLRDSGYPPSGPPHKPTPTLAPTDTATATATPSPSPSDTTAPGADLGGAVPLALNVGTLESPSTATGGAALSESAVPFGAITTWCG